MGNSTVSRTLSVHEILLKLEAAGLNDDLAKKIIESKDNYLATKIVKYIKKEILAHKKAELIFGRELSTFTEDDWLLYFKLMKADREARKIMGRNMFGIEEAIRHFGVNPSKKQLAALTKIPFSEEVLKQCHATHVLIAIFPLSILDIRNKVKKSRLLYDNSWYEKSAYAKKRGKIGWQLVQKTPVRDSWSKSFGKQQTLISPEDEVPTAQILVYTIIGHYLATGERLFEHDYVRTSDYVPTSSVTSSFRTYIGHFGAVFGLYICNDRDDICDNNISVSSARKSDFFGLYISDDLDDY